MKGALNGTKQTPWVNRKIGAYGPMRVSNPVVNESLPKNAPGHRNVQFAVGSSEIDQLPGSIGEQPRYCFSVRLVRTLIGSAKSTEKTAKSRVLVAYLRTAYWPFLALLAGL